MTAVPNSIDVPSSARGQSWSRSKPTEQTIPRGSRQRSAALGIASKNCSWPVFLLLIALIVPWEFSVGPLRLSLYRFVLLVMFLPCLFLWATGRAGRIRIPDILLILYSFWCALGLVVLHGMAIATQPVGIGLIETLGAYLLARCYVRDADDFYNVAKVLFGTVLFLLPFAILEFATGQRLLRAMFGIVLPVPNYPSEVRMGFTRVTSVFDHPIMFGYYSGAVLGLSFLVLGYRQRLASRSFKSATVAATAFLSLSAGPIGAVVLQGMLLTWNEILRSVRTRWKILIGLLLSLFVLLEIVAKRSALTIIVSFFLFDSSSYWYRRLIWDYGSATALNHPFFGVGLYDWERPSWMPATTIDNFWLFQAIRSGIPAVSLLLMTICSITLVVAFKKGLDDRLVEYRTAFLIAMTFFFLAGWTGHFWGNVYVIFIFLLGSGVWMMDTPKTDVGEATARKGLAFENLPRAKRTPVEDSAFVSCRAKVGWGNR